MGDLIPTAATALATAVLPGIFIVVAVHTIRRRRDYATPTPGAESVFPASNTLTSSKDDQPGRSRFHVALQVGTIICALVVVVKLLQRSPDQKCVRSSANLRHADLYTSTQHLSSLPASTDAKAQGLFDAALIHAFGFYHVDALALFESAAQADPECSMCIWGKAYVSGPFINRAILEAEERPAYPVFSCSDTVKAQKIALQGKGLSEAQAWPPFSQELADAMVLRYTGQGACTTHSLQQSELQYGKQLAQIAHQHQDATIAALAAEAYMNVYAWNYTIAETSAVLWDDTATALNLINYALSLQPMHVLALHLKIHLLETQPLHPLPQLQESQPRAPTDSAAPDNHTDPIKHESGVGGLQEASLHEAEAAADTLARLRDSTALPGHLIHMPAHIFFRVGRWTDGIEASVAAVDMNMRESHSCFSPYAPEHNLDTGLVTAILAGDYERAQWAADHLQQSRALFRRTYVSDGINHAAAVEVALYFGRCNEVKPRLQVGSRGRSSSNGDRYVQALATLRDILCIAQPALSGARKASSSDNVAERDVTVARLVNSLAVQAVEMPEDLATVPGFGVGLYSAGYHTLVSIFSLLANAAEACMAGNWTVAANFLRQSVQLEFSMGYMEPPRLSMSTRPCLATLLLLAGQLDAAKSVVDADQQQFPNNWWGLQASLALSAVNSSIPQPQRAATEACRLLFGNK